MKRLFEYIYSDFLSDSLKRKDVNILALSAFVLSLPMLVFYWESGSDLGAYYVPMTRAFANGDFSSAFYPMIPPLQVVMAGIIAMVPIVSPYFALKVVSVSFFVLAVFPLYHLFIKLFPQKEIAFGSSLLFVFCPKIIKHVGYGELESGKIFFYILASYLLVSLWKNLEIKKIYFLAPTLAGISLIRGEGLLYALVAWAAIAIIIFMRHKVQNMLIHFLLSFFLFVVFLSPWVSYVHIQTGYYATDIRQIKLLNRYAGSIDFVQDVDPGLSKSPENLQLIKSKIISFNEIEPSKRLPTSKWDSLFARVIKGVYIVYFPFLCLGIVLILKRREFQVCHAVLLTLWLLNLFVFLWASNFSFIDSRYVMHGLPFLLPFIWVGVSFIFSWRFLNRQLVVVMCLFLLFFAGNERAIGSLYKKLSNHSLVKNHLLACEFIDNNRNICKKFPPLKSTLDRYHTGLSPVVLFGYRRCGSFVECDFLFINDFTSNRVFSLEEMEQVVLLKNVHFVVVDKLLRRLNDKIDSLEENRNFVILSDFGMDDNRVTVYGYIPHMIIPN